MNKILSDILYLFQTAVFETLINPELRLVLETEKDELLLVQC